MCNAYVYVRPYLEIYTYIINKAIGLLVLIHTYIHMHIRMYLLTCINKLSNFCMHVLTYKITCCMYIIMCTYSYALPDHTCYIDKVLSVASHYEANPPTYIHGIGKPHKCSADLLY